MDKKAALAQAKAKAASPKAEDGAIMRYVKPEETKDRTRVIFDDSGSMSHQIDNAKQGVTEYMRNCPQNQVAVSIHFLCTNTEESASLENLSADLPAQSQALTVIKLHLGGTPLFTKLNEVVNMPLTTRMVAFTDGSPTDRIVNVGSRDYTKSTLDVYKENADVIISQAIEKKIPIDTVFFGGSYSENEIGLLKYLSERTGGIFLHFDPAKVNFAKAFKYLAPTFRKMLMSPTFRAELEAGKHN
ncbi:MAG TPA: hypothetical protein VII99_10645 [Bacteroidia bacterium]